MMGWRSLKFGGVGSSSAGLGAATARRADGPVMVLSVLAADPVVPAAAHQVELAVAKAVPLRYLPHVLDRLLADKRIGRVNIHQHSHVVAVQC